MIDYGAYANIANSILGAYNSYTNSKRTIGQLKEDYDFLQGHYQSSYNQVLIDYGASNSELQLQGSYLLGARQQLESNSGIENLGLKTNPVRQQQIQLLQLKEDNIKDIINKNEYNNVMTERQITAQAKQSRADIITGIVSSIGNIAVLAL